MRGATVSTAANVKVLKNTGIMNARLASNLDEEAESSITGKCAVAAFQAKATRCANQSALSEAATNITAVAIHAGDAMDSAHAVADAMNDVFMHLVQ